MTRIEPPKVLILTRDARDAATWASRLAAAASCVWTAIDQVPADGEVDVLVTDLPPSELPDLPGAGLIALGSETPGDATLAADCAPGELLLACRLVGEIARLRRHRDAMARRHEQIRQLAETDPLTGLGNRRAWDDELRAWLSTGFPQQNRWLGLVDLDRFKQVNDTLGMARGDDVLRRAAQALAAQLRRDDRVARLGGDEFGVLLVGVDDQHVAAVFDRLRQSVAEALGGEPVPVTASIGYVPLSDLPATALLAAAERAMRHAKQHGGNRIERGSVDVKH